MISNPFSQIQTRQSASGKEKDQLFGFIDRGCQFISIEDKECFHGCMANPFIAIDKGMIHHKGEAGCGGFFRKSGIQILTRELHLRLG